MYLHIAFITGGSHPYIILRFDRHTTTWIHLIQSTLTQPHIHNIVLEKLVIFLLLAKKFVTDKSLWTKGTLTVLHREVSFTLPIANLANKADSYLVETNVTGVFTETLTTDVQVVLADQTSTVSTDTTR